MKDELDQLHAVADAAYRADIHNFDQSSRDTLSRALAILHGASGLTNSVSADGNLVPPFDWKSATPEEQDRRKEQMAEALDRLLRPDPDRLDWWAGCVRRMFAVAPIDAVAAETGSTDRAESIRIVDDWLWQDARPAGVEHPPTTALEAAISPLTGQWSVEDERVPLLLTEFAWTVRTLRRYGITSDERHAELAALSGVDPATPRGSTFANLGTAIELAMDPDTMCPNCVTPWKCNGPHTPATTGADYPTERREPLAKALDRLLAIGRRDLWRGDAFAEAAKAVALLADGAA